MNITNQLKDEYPCSKCSFSKRLSCNSYCQELIEWMERLSDVGESKNKIVVSDASRGIYIERSSSNVESDIV